MENPDYSLSSEALLEVTANEEDHKDSLSEVSSEIHEKPDSPTPKISSDLQQIIFVKLQEVSKQNIEAGYIDQALHGFERCTEQLLTILRGDTNAKVFQDYLHTTLKYLNDISLKHLRANDLENTLKILNKCLEISHPEPYKAHPEVQSLTFNHLGCCYRRMGDLDQALYCLQKALHYHEKALENGFQGQFLESSSITHVNLCAVLSQKGNHREALEHAKRAVADCTREFIHTGKLRGDPSKADQIRKKATMLAIAYYNLGVEEDFCQQPDAALESYNKAYQLAEEYNGVNDPVTLRFHQAYQEAKSKKRLVSPARTSVKKQASPPRVTPKTYRTPGLRPQSAKVVLSKDSSRPKLDSFASPRLSNNKLSFLAVSNPAESELNTPKSNIQRASLSNNKTMPVFSNRLPPKHTATTARKKQPRLPTANSKLFFPMGNMAPLVEPEKPKKATTPKPQRPQRPMTAHTGGSAQEHRLNRPLSPKVEFGESRNRRFFTRSDVPGQQTTGDNEYEDQNGKPTIIISRPPTASQYSNRFQTQITPSPKYQDTRERYMNRNNKGQKWISVGAEFGEDAGFSFQSKERSPKTVLEGRPFKRFDPGNALYQCAALIVQKNWRGWCFRDRLWREEKVITGQKYWTGLVKKIKRNLEDSERVGEYLVIMVYEREEAMIYVEMKDLERRVVYKGRLEYLLGMEELKLVCESLLDNLGIEDERIVFKRKEAEEMKDEEGMQNISERSEESDVGPLIEALGKERTNDFIDVLAGDEEIDKGEEFPKEEIVEEIKLERMDTHETQGEVSRKGDSQLVQSDREKSDINLSSKGGSLPAIEKSLKNSKEGKVGSRESAQTSRRSKTSKKSKGSLKASSYQDVDSKGSKVLLFAKKAIVKGHILSFKLESQPKSKRLLLTCLDVATPGKFERVDLPYELSEKQDINVGDLLDQIVIDFDPFKVGLKESEDDPRHAYDSFSSHDNASIVNDIFEKNNNQEMSELFRSESLKKQSFNDENQRRFLRGMSSSILDGNTPRADKEPPQFLGMGLRMPKLPMNEDPKCFTLGIRVPEVSSGREQSAQDLQQAWKGLKDSKSTLSQGEFTQRSEIEGSIMLRVAEGVTLVCRVLFKKGEQEVVVKYSTNGEQAEEVPEVRLSLEQLGIEEEKMEKDLLFEKVRSFMGKRVKYRNGNVIFLHKKGTNKVSSMNEEKSQDMTKTTQKEEDIDEKKLETSLNAELKNQKTEGDMESSKKESSKELKDTQGTILKSKEELSSPRERIQKPIEEMRRNTEGLRIFLRKPTEDESGNRRQEIMSQESPIKRGETFGRNESFSGQSPRMSRNSPRLKPEGDTRTEEGTLIETFGQLQSFDSTNEIDSKSPASPQKRYRMMSIDENIQSSKMPKTTSIGEQFEKKVKGRLRVVSSPDTLSPKRVYNKTLNLKPPEYKKEDSSPKVKSNFSLKSNESDGVRSIWGTLLSKKADSGEENLNENNSKPYVGDLPRIVIHGEKGGSKVIDFKVFPKAMSLGILENDVKYSPVSHKHSSRGFSMALNDNNEEVIDDWSKVKGGHKKERAKIHKKEVNSSKDSLKGKRKGHDQEINELRTSLIMEVKSKK